MSWTIFHESDAAPLGSAGIDYTRSPNSDALAAALTASSVAESVLLMPSPVEQRVLVLHIKKLQNMAAPSESPRLGFASSGILGLDGDAVYLDELPKPKPWWKKIFSRS